MRATARQRFHLLSADVTRAYSKISERNELCMKATKQIYLNETRARPAKAAKINRINQHLVLRPNVIESLENY